MDMSGFNKEDSNGTKMTASISVFFPVSLSFQLQTVWEVHMQAFFQTRYTTA
jgi:hypothetical protein